jgi:hypothetical protein
MGSRAQSCWVILKSRAHLQWVMLPGGHSSVGPYWVARPNIMGSGSINLGLIGEPDPVNLGSSAQLVPATIFD